MGEVRCWIAQFVEALDTLRSTGQHVFRFAMNTAKECKYTGHTQATHDIVSREANLAKAAQEANE